MARFKVRELRSTDVDGLLAFEVRNREWFESQIDARDPAFYSVQGVGEHIEEYLCGLAQGTWHPFVIEDADERIVGRANLKSINPAQGVAQVGYRVDQQLCGQGLATLALKHLIQQAQVRWQLRQLVAYVFKENIGSRKVLDRCGFLLEEPAANQPVQSEYCLVLAL